MEHQYATFKITQEQSDTAPNSESASETKINKMDTKK